MSRILFLLFFTSSISNAAELYMPGSSFPFVSNFRTSDVTLKEISDKVDKINKTNDEILFQMYKDKLEREAEDFKRRVEENKIDIRRLR